MNYLNFFTENKEIFLGAHIVFAILGVLLAFVADATFMLCAKDKVITKEEGMRLIKISKYIWIAVTLILVSGVSVFMSDIEYYLSSVKFLSKMTVVGVIAFNGSLLYKLVQPNFFVEGFLSSPQYANKRRLASALGAVSFVSWVSALVLAFSNSVPFSYSQIMFIYILTLALGVSVSIFLESKSFK